MFGTCLYAPRRIPAVCLKIKKEIRANTAEIHSSLPHFVMSCPVIAFLFLPLSPWRVVNRYIVYHMNIIAILKAAAIYLFRQKLFNFPAQRLLSRYDSTLRKYKVSPSLFLDEGSLG